MSWRLRELSGEALRNLAASPARTLALVTGLAIVFGALAMLELRDARAARSLQRQLTEAGAYVAVATIPPGGGDAAARCEALRTLPGVVAAGGASTPSLTVVQSKPGSPVQQMRVTPGVFRAWDPAWRTPLTLDGHPAVVIGDVLAAEAGLRQGAVIAVSGAARVAAILRSSRHPQIARRVLVPEPAGVTAISECWVEFSPSAYAAGTKSLAALLVAGDAVPAVRAHVAAGQFQRDPASQWATRPQRTGWPAVSVVAAGALALTAWFRRAELGLYLALGTRRVAVFHLLAVESAVLLAAALALGSAYAIALDAALHASLPTGSVGPALRTTALASALAMALAPLLGILTVRGSIADLLKDR